MLILLIFMIAQTQSTTHFRYGMNIFQRLFTEPVEIVYMLMFDGALFAVVGYDETGVSISIDTLEKELEKHGYKISNMMIIIHNHLRGGLFSDTDKTTYYYLKNHKGFKGSFLLRLPTGKIVPIERWGEQK